MTTNHTLTMIVPCHNEETVIRDFVKEMADIQDQLPCNLKLLLVNDGSTDMTMAMIRAAKKEYPELVNYISFSRNFGKEAAMKAGFDRADTEYVGVMDADLQHPPSVLPEMMNRLVNTHNNLDVVATKRTDREGEPWLVSRLSELFYNIISVDSSVKLQQGIHDYRVMTKQVCDEIKNLPEQHRYTRGLFEWVGFNMDYVEIPHITRESGDSSWSFNSLFKYAINGLTSFTTLPIKAVQTIGSVMVMVALIGLVVQLFNYHPIVFLVVWSLFLTGLLFVGMGILGEYLAKIYEESKGRPHYIIEEENIDD